MKQRIELHRYSGLDGFHLTCSFLNFPDLYARCMLYLSNVFFSSVICCSFWTRLGACMTKLNPDETKIHIIGNNVTGNKKGESLLTFLSKAMRPSKVKVESPLELGQAGQWLWWWLIVLLRMAVNKTLKFII